MKDKPGFFYGWIVAICGSLVMLTAGSFFYSFGVFFKPIEDEFGWTRASISIAFAIYSVSSALTNFLGGRLVDKLGVKVPLAIAAVFACLGFCLLSTTQNLWHLYLFPILVGLGIGPIWPVILATVQRWFMKLRGFVLGLTLAGTGLGAVVFAILSDYLISEYGWRTSYIILGIIVGAILALGSLVMITSPEKKGLKAYGEEDISNDKDISAAPSEVVSKVWTTQIWSTREALKSRAFWFLCIMYIAGIIPAYIVANHFVRYCIDIGITETVAAGALGFLGGISVAGRILVGRTADRLGWKTALSVCSFVMAASLFWLTKAETLWMIYLFAVVYGFFYGGRITTIPGIIGFFFGMSSIGEITGIILASGAVCGCFGPFIAGYIFDHTGSYTIAFSMAAVLCIIAGIIVLMLKPPQKSSA